MTSPSLTPDSRHAAAGNARDREVVIDVNAPCRRLTTSQQQLVEIAKALAFEARAQENGRTELVPFYHVRGSEFKR